MAASPEAQLTPGRRWLILIAIMLESMMTGVDNSITAVSLHRMQGTFSATQDEITLVVTAYLVGLVAAVPLAGAISVRIGRRLLLLIVVGSGFSFIPVNFLAFSTIAPRFRADATSLFSLMMNIGGSVGISTMVTKLIRDAQINHEQLAAHVTHYSTFQRHVVMPDVWDPATTTGLAVLNELVTKQALMSAYVNAFTFLVLFSAVVVVLAFVMRRVKPRRLVAAAREA